MVNECCFDNDNFIEMVICAIGHGEGKVVVSNSMWCIRERTMQDHWGARHNVISQKHNVPDITKYCSYLNLRYGEGYGEIGLKRYLDNIWRRAFLSKILRFVPRFQNISSELAVSIFHDFMSKYDDKK